MEKLKQKIKVMFWFVSAGLLVQAVISFGVGTNAKKISRIDQQHIVIKEQLDRIEKSLR